MHATQQQQRVNHSMSIDSFGLSVSKLSSKKSPFYKHQDPYKLNYYARFSPNRKIIQKTLQPNVLQGTSPLSPRTQKSSASSKKSSKSIQKKVIKSVSRKKQKLQFEIIDPNILLQVNQKHQQRGDIYIDDGDDSAEDSIKQNQNRVDARQMKNNHSNQEKYSHARFVMDNTIYQNPKQSSSSQESSSFERLIEPSSSEDNDIPFFPIKNSGGQMLIQDDESSSQENNETMPFKSKDRLHIIENSQSKILDLAKSIGAYKQQQSRKIPKKQTQSQNISFSLDSELSLIEQKWNSYFQNDQEGLNTQQQILNQPFFSQNVSQNLFGNHPNQHKMSPSSSEELPSFSNPEHSDYNLSQIENQRISTISEKNSIYDEYQRNKDNQTKQFKRQFTFGNQLNAIFAKGNQQKEKYVQSEKKQSLLKKIMPKNALQILNQKKDKNKSIQNQSKQNNLYKPLNNSNIKSLKNSNVKTVSKHNQVQLSNKKHQIIQKQESAQIINKKDSESQSNLKKEQSQLLSTHFVQENKNNNEILIIDEPQITEQKTINISPKNQINFQKINRKNFKQVKSNEKQRKRAIWQQTLKDMLQKEIKQKQLNQSNQKQQNVQKVQNNQEKYEKHNQQQNQKVDIQNEDIQARHQQISNRAQKFNEQNSYSKLYSQKRVYQSRKGSYNDRPKISQSQYQSQQDDTVSQKGKPNSQLKSQDGESFTTTTQQTGQYTQIYSHYFSRNRSNCTQQVQRLKKYLKKIDDSLVTNKKQNKQTHTFQLNESFQSSRNQKLSKNYSNQDSSLEEGYQAKEQTQNLVKPAFNFIEISKDEKKEKLKDEHIQLVDVSPMKQKLKTPNKINKERNQLSNKKFQQCAIISSKAKQQNKPMNFSESLQKLQNIILNDQNQFTKVYQKIYTQLYQQQLKYQQKLQKQELLLNVMQMFIHGEKQKINCEEFLIHQQMNFDMHRVRQNLIERSSRSKQEQWQIFVNKHIILALVRNVANKQIQTKAQSTSSNQ